MSENQNTPEKKKTIQIIDLQGNRTEEVTVTKDDSKKFENQEVYIDPAKQKTEAPISSFSFYMFTRQFIRFVMNLFFRDITVLGTHNVPQKGPVIFCGNHANQFNDGNILLGTAPRNVRFMVAAKVSKNIFSFFDHSSFMYMFSR